MQDNTLICRTFTGENPTLLMHPVDALQLHFNPDQMIVLNIAMAFLMFGVALDVKPGDFRKVVEFPKSVAVGLLAQYLIFPLLTLAIIYLFRPPVSVAMGMVLVSYVSVWQYDQFSGAFCPGQCGIVGYAQCDYHSFGYGRDAGRLFILVEVYTGFRGFAPVIRDQIF